MAPEAAGGKKELRIALQSLLNCSNQLRAGGFHKHDNINVCDRCHNELYGPAKVGKILE